MCPFCQEKYNGIDNLLFECSYVANIPNQLLSWQGVRKSSLMRQDELQGALQYMNESDSTTQLYRMTLASVMYNVLVEIKTILIHYQEGYK